MYWIQPGVSWESFKWLRSGEHWLKEALKWRVLLIVINMTQIILKKGNLVQISIFLESWELCWIQNRTENYICRNFQQKNLHDLDQGSTIPVLKGQNPGIWAGKGRDLSREFCKTPPPPPNTGIGETWPRYSLHIQMDICIDVIFQAQIDHRCVNYFFYYWWGTRSQPTAIQNGWEWRRIGALKQPAELSIDLLIFRG